MTKCTWKDKSGRCINAATRKQHDKHNKVWAHLCETHHTMLDDALLFDGPARIMHCWVSASGGALALVERM